jgi:hypothetical protein
MKTQTVRRFVSTEQCALLRRRHPRIERCAKRCVNRQIRRRTIRRTCSRATGLISGCINSQFISRHTHRTAQPAWPLRAELMQQHGEARSQTFCRRQRSIAHATRHANDCEPSMRRPQFMTQAACVREMQTPGVRIKDERDGFAIDFARDSGWFRSAFFVMVPGGRRSSAVRQREREAPNRRAPAICAGGKSKARATGGWQHRASRSESDANTANDAFGKTLTPAAFGTARLAVRPSRQRQQPAQRIAVRIEPESAQAETSPRGKKALLARQFTTNLTCHPRVPTSPLCPLENLG